MRVVAAALLTVALVAIGFAPFDATGPSVAAGVATDGCGLFDIEPEPVASLMGEGYNAPPPWIPVS